MKMYIKETGFLLADDVEIADSFLSRTRGLMFRRNIPKKSALIITPCNSIHMFFMRFPIDVLFVNKDNEIVGIIQGIKPWRVSRIYWGSYYVVELPVGTVNESNLKIGDTLYIEQ